MDERIKKLWLGALRSGNYIQGRGYLRSEIIKGRSEFCCLGVLCDLHSVETGNAWFNSDEEFNAMEYFKATDILPLEVVSWANLDSQNPYVNSESIHFVKDPGLREPLTELNDNGASFSEIADLIEQYL